MRGVSCAGQWHGSTAVAHSAAEVMGGFLGAAETELTRWPLVAQRAVYGSPAANDEKRGNTWCFPLTDG